MNSARCPPTLALSEKGTKACYRERRLQFFALFAKNCDVNAFLGLHIAGKPTCTVA
jgi:hypothetical protein